MGKSVGLIAIVLAVWAMVEIYTQGVDGAFGGVFADGVESEAVRRASPAERAGDAVNRAHERQAARYDELLDDRAGEE